MPEDCDQTGIGHDPLDEGSVSEPNDLYFDNTLIEDEAVEDFLRERGYTVEVTPLELPTRSTLGSGIEEHVASVPGHVDLSEPEAAREFIALPILFAAARAAGGKIERFVKRFVAEKPGGMPKASALLDYRIRGDHGRLIVETRYSDLERGALRLAGQMAVTDLVELTEESPDTRPVYGVLISGGAWRFLALTPTDPTSTDQGKRITRDLNLYGVPPDVRQVLQRLAGIVGGPLGPGE